MEETGGFPERGVAIGRDWTKGNIFRNLLMLSWPMMISFGLNMAGPTIDMIWVGRLGAASVAGVGVGGIAVMLVISAMFGLNTGVRAMVARFVGAGDVGSANHVARQAYFVCIAFSIVVAVVGIFFADLILILMGLEADVVAEGAAYMRILFVGMLGLCLQMVTESIMQASGDAVVPMRISIFIRAIHVALCPFLIFGWWMFPRLGVSGAALTNVIAQSLGATIGLWILFTGRSRLRLTLSNFRVDLNLIWRIVKIGIPASVRSIQGSLGQFLLVRIISPFGTLPVAAYAICQRVEMILFMPSVGLGMAAGVLGGQNLGAGQPGRAQKGGWLAAGVVEGLLLAFSGAILLWGESIAGIFGPDPALREMSGAFLRIAVVGYSVLAGLIVFSMFLAGVGDTVPSMIFSLIMTWVVMLPAAYFLSQFTHLGVYGVRWAMVASMVVGAVSHTIYFRTGRWKRKRV